MSNLLRILSQTPEEQDITTLEALRQRLPARAIIRTLLGPVTMPFEDVAAHAERLPEPEQAELANSLYIRLNPEGEEPRPDGSIPRVPALLLLAFFIFGAIAFNAGIATERATTDQAIRKVLDRATAYTDNEVRKARADHFKSVGILRTRLANAEKHLATPLLPDAREALGGK